MKKWIVLLLCSALLLSGCAATRETLGAFKYVGSRDTEGFSCDMEIYEDAGKLFTDSKLVIIGTADSVDQVSEEFGGETLIASRFNVTAEEVLKGDMTIGSVSVLQMGTPKSDDCETKLKVGRRYVLFLNPKDFQGETVYDCTGLEQGIFEVDKDNRLYSYVDFGVCVTFDNQMLNAIKDIAAK